MSGFVRRCDACGAEVVVRRWHRRRPAKCLECGAALEVVPLDFAPFDVADESDRRGAEQMESWLALSVLAGCCMPIPAGVWWWASGAIGRARDEGRAPLPILLRLRVLAIVAVAIELSVWAIFLGRR